ATLAHPANDPIEYGGLGDDDAVIVKADIMPALGGQQLAAADARSRRIWDADLAPLRLAERSRRRRIGACLRLLAMGLWPGWLERRRSWLDGSGVCSDCR